MVQIPIHSLTDLITNSSTVIYTYSDNCVEAMEAMVDEFFEAFGVGKKCSDVFKLVVMLEDDYDCIYEADSYRDIVPEQFTKHDEMKSLLKQVRSGETDKPEWLTALEKRINVPGGTVLNIIAKSPEYEKLAKLVSKFLYSPNHELTYDG